MKQRGRAMKYQEYILIINVQMLFIFLCLNKGYAIRDWSSDPPPAWARESAFGAAKITSLDVICGKEQMTVRAEFSSPFQGIIFSKGTYGQDNCVYIKPYSGITHATFSVRYDQCGTKPDLQGKYYENTIVIQYGTDIIEAYDEAKRLRCEWFEAYEKPATFRPAIPVADLDVIEMNFQGDEIDCWMSIQEGKGPWAQEVSRIVAVGQPMTIVIAINDYKNQFDMRVKSCFAHDGIKPAIHLTDEYGCVLRPKMLTPFKKIRDSKGKATLISYAQFLAFKFPDTMDVQVQCTVEVCRHGCADACQVGNYQPKNPSVQVSADIPYSSNVRRPPHSHQSNRPDDEQSLYQNIENLPQPPVPDIQGEEFTDDESDLVNLYDINPKNLGLDRSQYQDQTNQSPDYYQTAESQRKTEINKNFDNFNQKIYEPEIDNNPVFNKNSDNKMQANNNEEKTDSKAKKTNLDISISNLKPEDLNIANKMLSNYGINKENIDFNNLAAKFAHGLQPDLSSLLQNDRLKELASKLVNKIEMNPIAAALSSNANITESVVNDNIVLHENGDNSHYATYAQPQHLQHAQHVQHPQHSHLQLQSQPQPHSQPHSQPQLAQSAQTSHSTLGASQNEHNSDKPHISHLVSSNNENEDFKNMHHTYQQQFDKKLASVSKPTTSSGPVAQVLQVPLQPGFPLHQVIPNNIPTNNHINFINVQKTLPSHLHRNHPNIHQMLKSHSPLIQNAFPPLHTSTHEIMQSIANHIKDRPNMRLKPNLQSIFPHGPRALRLKRSNNYDGEIGLRKGFQVVTSVDLAFFPNVTTDSAPIYEGRRDNIIYGVCMPVAQLATGLSCILWLIVVSFTSCACMIYKLDRFKKSTLSGN